jgi:hypothetical protein
MESNGKHRDSHRYGFATPYDGSEHGCGGVAYYAEVTVTTALDACVRGTTTEPVA